MKKQDRHNLIRERARAALLDLYHNATPKYPIIDCEFEIRAFDEWFADTARFEIEFINDGGAYLSDKTMLDHYKKKYKSNKTVEYAYRKYKRTKSLEQSGHFAYEKIINYGDLYQYGRGGRTLAPEHLTAGGSRWRIDESPADEWNIGELCELIQILESFNAMVNAWNRSIPEQWESYKADCPEILEQFAA